MAAGQTAAASSAPLAVRWCSCCPRPTPDDAELVRPEPEVVAGRITLPTEPGLGVELVPEALERYRVG